jgi:hypothetical protein
MDTTVILIVLVAVIALVFLLGNNRPVKQLDDRKMFIIKLINRNPDILNLRLTFDDLVELEEVLNESYHQGKALVSNSVYDKLKVELSKKIQIVSKLSNKIKFIIKLINQNPDKEMFILSQLSYIELVELESVASNYYYNDKKIISNSLYDSLKVEIEKKKNSTEHRI